MEARFSRIARESGPEARGEGTLSLAELGAHSLKLHALRDGVIHTCKVPYDLGRDVFTAGRIGEATERAIVGAIRQSGLSPRIVLGTSAVREAANARATLARVREALGAKAFVLSCWEEATLLAAGYASESGELPALVADIGGGSTEIVYLTRNRGMVWESLPIGADRLVHSCSFDLGRGISERVDQELSRASIVRFDKISATGGTVRAVARTLAQASFTRKDLLRLEADVRRHGSPSHLAPDRAAVFLAGVLIARKLLEWACATAMSWVDLSIGRAYLETLDLNGAAVLESLLARGPFHVFGAAHARIDGWPRVHAGAHRATGGSPDTAERGA
jgi:hypothetical protein